MGRKWMYLQDGLCKEYIDGVKSFTNMARISNNKEETRCPCRDCKNFRIHHLNTIDNHLYRFGFTRNYKNGYSMGKKLKIQ